MAIYKNQEAIVEYRRLGASGLKVSALSFGAGTFGGRGPLFSHWGTTGAREARRLLDICIEAGVNTFDSADVYSDGAADEVLGEAVKGRRAGWSLDPEQTAKLDAASAVTPPYPYYPYYRQEGFASLNPPVESRRMTARPV